jgi:hypothetical protein
MGSMVNGRTYVLIAFYLTTLICNQIKILGSNLYFDLKFDCILFVFRSQVSLQVFGHHVYACPEHFWPYVEIKGFAHIPVYVQVLALFVE